MEINKQITGFDCPKCNQSILPDESFGGSAHCSSCNWKGHAYLFRPLVMIAENSQAAVPDDALCAFHPNKRAVAVCEGAGNFICSLCMVELNGKTYSVQYIDGKGKKEFGKTFDRYLDRPDYTINMLLVFSLFVPFIVPITIPFVIHRFFIMRKMQKENPLYAKLIGKGKVIMYGIFMLLCLISLIGFIGLIISAPA